MKNCHQCKRNPELKIKNEDTESKQLVPTLNESVVNNITSKISNTLNANSSD